MWFAGTLVHHIGKVLVAVVAPSLVERVFSMACSHRDRSGSRESLEENQRQISALRATFPLPVMHFYKLVHSLKLSITSSVTSSGDQVVFQSQTMPSFQVAFFYPILIPSNLPPLQSDGQVVVIPFCRAPCSFLMFHKIKYKLNMVGKALH